MKLNFCCGDRPLPDFINYDFRSNINKLGYPTEIIQSDILKMDESSFERDSVDEIYFLDAIEHFLKEDRYKILSKFYQWLKPGGLILIQTPNLETISKMLIQSLITPDEAARKIFGGQDYIGNFHYWLFTPESISVELIENGFTIIDIRETDDFYWTYENRGKIQWPAITNMVIHGSK